MVVIDLAPSFGAALGKGVAGGIAGYNRGRQRAVENDQRQQALEIAKQRMEVYAAAQEARAATLREVQGQQLAGLAQGEMSRRGIGTDADVDMAFSKEAAAGVGDGPAKGFAQAGPAGAAAALGAGVAVPAARAAERKRALAHIFQGLSPEMRQKVVQQGIEANEEQNRQAFSVALLKKIRMLDRAGDVMEGHEDSLGPMAESIDRLIQSGQATTKEGLRAAMSMADDLEKLQIENMNDQMRKVRSDNLEQGMLQMAAGNPFLTTTAMGIALANRNGFYETPEDAWAAWLVEWNPGAFKAGQKVSAESAAKDQMLALRKEAMQAFGVGEERFDDKGNSLGRAMASENDIARYVNRRLGRVARHENAVEGGMSPQGPPLGPTGQQPAPAAPVGPQEQPAPVDYSALNESQRGAIDKAISDGATLDQLGIDGTQVPMPTLERWAKQQNTGKKPERPAGAEFMHAGDDPRFSDESFPSGDAPDKPKKSPAGAGRRKGKGQRRRTTEGGGAEYSEPLGAEESSPPKRNVYRDAFVPDLPDLPDQAGTSPKERRAAAEAGKKGLRDAGYTGPMSLPAIDKWLAAEQKKAKTEADRKRLRKLNEAVEAWRQGRDAQ